MVESSHSHLRYRSTAHLTSSHCFPLASNWFTTAWTTGGAATAGFLGKRAFDWVAIWQEDRKNVDDKDHDLLHQMVDVMMDKPPSLFSKGSVGVVTRLGNVEETVTTIKSVVDQILERLPAK